MCPRHRFPNTAMPRFGKKINNIKASVVISPGVVNSDGEINIADLNALLDLILSLDAPPLAADLNTDGELNIADLNTLINLLLSPS